MLLGNRGEVVELPFEFVDSVEQVVVGRLALCPAVEHPLVGALPDPREAVPEACQLDLNLGAARACLLGEDFEDDAMAVNDRRPHLVFEIDRLSRGEFRVNDDSVGPALRN